MVVINFVKMLFSGVCFIFMYLFVYVIVKSNDLWVGSVSFADVITVLNELADIHG